MKILVVQLRRLGDILLTTPVLPYLKSIFPNAQVDFLTEPPGKQVLDTNPHITNLLIYNKKQPFKEIKRIRKKNYDFVFDFLNNPRSRLLTFFSGARYRVGRRLGYRSLFYNVRVSPPNNPCYVPLGKIKMIQGALSQLKINFGEPKTIRPQLYLTPDDENFAHRWEKKELGIKATFCILVPTHRHPIRRWKWEYFRELGLKISQEKKISVFLAYGPGEEDLINQIRHGVENEIKILPTTSLREMAAIFKKARVVVTNDNGPMHTAVAMETPTITIYGPTRPIDWNPSLTETPGVHRDKALVAHEVACLGCHLSRCPVGHLCMSHLTVNDVFKVCETILSPFG